ncbi:germ cell-specific gene 1-like protein isoform X3 [Pimephales promelas]|uniref:germ cell-specific gene 1-like protein isoform X3 n=1 Tax=Pimephales promelas TaxID=90988 RepID=UPI001955D765|nr:germ cell-specific gene 1-like protein isoform X3 [Pimephales promelas]
MFSNLTFPYSTARISSSTGISSVGAYACKASFSEPGCCLFLVICFIRYYLYHSTMLEQMSRRSRSLLSLSLTSLALALSVLAFCTSYWCEGTHKVVKPLCLSPVKMKNCGQNNSQPYTAEVPTADPKKPASNVTMSPKQKEEMDRIKAKNLANAVHYIWETGEDKYMLRYFHTGFWLSCEKHSEGEKCRSFIELTPGETQGVLWLSVISEFAYISLLAMGFLLMWVELLLLCLNKEMHALKINAFAAMCTVLSGLMGMVAHMMYTTVFQMTVSIGPKDWRPQTWDYGWSFALHWCSSTAWRGSPSAVAWQRPFSP